MSLTARAEKNPYKENEYRVDVYDSDSGDFQDTVVKKVEGESQAQNIAGVINTIASMNTMVEDSKKEEVQEESYLNRLIHVDSSFIDAMMYDAKNNRMYIWMNNRDFGYYEEVPVSEFIYVVNAYSVGSVYNAYIKGKYHYIKLMENRF